MPEMRFITSSSIEAIGYDPDTMELHVRFLHSGAIYVYYNVESRVFDEFMQADSKGTHLNNQIKGIFDYRKL